MIKRIENNNIQTCLSREKINENISMIIREVKKAGWYYIHPEQDIYIPMHIKCMGEERVKSYLKEYDLRPLPLIIESTTVTNDDGSMFGHVDDTCSSKTFLKCYFGAEMFEIGLRG